MEEPKDLELKITEMTGAIGTLEKEADGIEVKTKEQAEQAAEILTRASGYKKRGEAIRLFFTKPLNDQVKRINERFNPAKKRLEEVEATVTGKIRTYREAEAEKIRKQQEKELEAQRKAHEKEQERQRKLLEKEDLSKKEEKAKKDEIEQQKFIPQEPATKQDTRVGSVGTRKVWDFEVLSEGIIPRRFLKVDDAEIRKAIRDGTRTVAGLRIFQREDYTKR